MAREVLTLTGAVVGAAFGSPQLGFMIGSMVGNAVDPVTIKGPSLGDAKIQNVQEGSPIAKVWGRAAIAGTICDSIPAFIVKKKVSQGKGGPVQEQERMLTSFAIAIGEPIEAIVRIWENDKLVFGAGSDGSFAGKFIFYNGDETQLPDSTFEAHHGVGNAPAYRGVSRIVVPNYDVTEKGQAIPRYLFEVTSNLEFGAAGPIREKWWLLKTNVATTHYAVTPSQFTVGASFTRSSPWVVTNQPIFTNPAMWMGDRVLIFTANGGVETVRDFGSLNVASTLQTNLIPFSKAKVINGVIFLISPIVGTQFAVSHDKGETWETHSSVSHDGGFSRPI